MSVPVAALCALGVTVPFGLGGWLGAWATGKATVYPARVRRRTRRVLVVGGVVFLVAIFGWFWYLFGTG